jgi:hypothetical protein
MSIFNRKVKHKGPLSELDESVEHFIFPIGISKVHVREKPISIAYLDQDRVVTDMFVLDVGTHRIRRPSDRFVVVEADKSTHYDCTFVEPYDPADPNRVSLTLTRPKTQEEELKDYFNMQMAKVLGQQQRDAIARGEVEWDPTQEVFSDSDLDDDDFDTPFSIYQMEEILNNMQADLQRRKEGTTVEPVEEVNKPAPEASGEAEPPTSPTPQSDSQS